MYREQILDHYKNPRNRGRLDDFTHYSGKVSNPLCGDEVEVWVQMSIVNCQLSNIVAIGFDGHGCAICIASASLLTEWAKEKEIQEVEQMTSETVTDLLGISLTPVRLKCALLVRDALREALSRGVIM